MVIARVSRESRFFFLYHELLHKISDLMLEWLGSASLSIRGDEL